MSGTRRCLNTNAPLTKVAPEVQQWLQKKLSISLCGRNSPRAYGFRLASLPSRLRNPRHKTKNPRHVYGEAKPSAKPSARLAVSVAQGCLFDVPPAGIAADAGEAQDHCSGHFAYQSTC